MSIADIQARAMAKIGRSPASARKGYFAAADKARRNANLKADGHVIPLSEWMGHNNGPDWFADLFVDYCWRKAAEAGVSYRDYVLEILEHGRYLQAGTH